MTVAEIDGWRAEDTAAAGARHLDVVGVTMRFGATTVLESLAIAVARNEFVSLLGPSGCGKTTLLRLIAGLLRPDAGRIVVGGRDLTGLPAHKRNVGVVFQNYALFPHLSVAENVAFGLEAQRVPKGEIAGRVRNALALVRMQDLADRRTVALSGGQQQRVAVARAIVVEPALLLLDEPFSALDRKLRETMQIEMRHLLRDLGITSIFVTHDQDEALVMSDRIAVMNAGRIEQLGTPDEVYRAPRSEFVLEFVGQSTRLAGRLAAAATGGATVAIETPLGIIRAPRSASARAAGEVVVGVRPEAITIGGEAGTHDNRLQARLADVVFLGSKTTLHFDVPAAGDRLIAEVARTPAGIAPGAVLTLSWPVSDTLVFAKP